MACCGNSDVSPEDSKLNREINRQLMEDKKKSESEIRLLLLGAGESGKSTIAKQMKIIHMDGFSDDERKSFKSIIHTNTYQSMKTLIQACIDLDIEISSKNKEYLDKFEEPFVESITPDLAAIMSNLWKDRGIKKAYSRRSEFQLTDSTEYYMNQLDRISAPDYLPTEQDVLRSRVQTTGIIETQFTVQGTKFIMVDVGGQRSERKKWMHCFEDVTAVIFCVALSAFDQTLYEDRKTNRMHEALKLFHEICTSKWFTETAMILFLNKSDLFAEKLKQGLSIKTAFDDYTGSSDFQESASFIERKFTDVQDPVTKKAKAIYPHITCATDTDNVKVVFAAVKDFILHQALYQSGLGV